MPKRRICNFAVIATTVVSATVLTILGTTGAAANASAAPDSTGVLCAPQTEFIPRACVQIFGSGTNIASMNGWANNPATSIYTGDSAHIELYYMTSGNFAASNGSDGDGDPELAPSIPVPRGNDGNCAGYTLTANSNSPPCSWDPAQLGENPVVNTGYYCSAIWIFYDPPVEPWLLASYHCAYVH